METLQILDEFEEGSTLQLASIGSRFVALLIDGLILLVMSIMVFIVIYFWISLLGLDDTTEFVDNLIFMAITFFYFGIQEGNDGTTVGKRAMNIKVVREDGEPMDLSKGFLRAFGRILSGILLIGYIMAFFNDENKTLHDNIAKTLVVKA